MGEVYPRRPVACHVSSARVFLRTARRYTAAVALLAAVGGCGRDEYVTVRGTVIDEVDRTPVGDALVRGEGGAESRTDSEGRFEIEMPKGRARLLRAAAADQRCPGEARIDTEGYHPDVEIRLAPRLKEPSDLLNVGFDTDAEMTVGTPCDEDPIVRWQQVAGPELGEQLRVVDGGRRMRLRTRAVPNDVAEGFIALSPEARADYRLAYAVDLGGVATEREIRVTAAPLSPGLPNVPIGYDQYVALEGPGEWSVSPDATLERVSDHVARFRAHEAGAYTIRHGVRTLRAVAAGYAPSATCVVEGCHATIADAWRETAHHKTSIANPACNECHSTGGFAASAIEHGVGCGACHGPGHPTNLDTKALWDGRVCTPCHDARNGPDSPHELWVVREWNATSKAGSPALTSARCAGCHTGDGFRASLGLEPRPVTTASLGCPTCHDSHGASAPHGLHPYDRLVGELAEMPVAGLGAGAVCAQCHNADLPEDDGPLNAPHAPQTNVLIGRGAMLLRRASEVGPHSRLQDSCVACHMATPDADHRGRTGGHTFAVRDLGAGAGLLVGSACESCHGSSVPPPAIGGLQDRDRDGTADGVRREFDRALSRVRQLLRARITRARVYDTCETQHHAVDVRVDGVDVILVDRESHPLGDCNGDGAVTNGEHGVGADRLSRHLRRLAWDTLLLHRDGSHGLHNPGFAFELLAAIRDKI